MRQIVTVVLMASVVTLLVGLVLLEISIGAKLIFIGLTTFLVTLFLIDNFG